MQLYLNEAVCAQMGVQEGWVSVEKKKRNIANPMLRLQKQWNSVITTFPDASVDTCDLYRDYNLTFTHESQSLSS